MVLHRSHLPFGQIASYGVCAPLAQKNLHINLEFLWRDPEHPNSPTWDIILYVEKSRPFDLTDFGMQ